MIQCNRCNLQYIGETKRRLKDRFNEHRRTIDNPNNKSKPTTAAEHFLSSPNHTANDMLLIPIEKIFSNRDSIRKAREAYLIQKGKTIDPAGLNIREETYYLKKIKHQRQYGLEMRSQVLIGWNAMENLQQEFP